MDNPVVKPCPFCGSIDIHVLREQRCNYDTVVNFWVVECATCGCRTQHYCEGEYNSNYAINDIRNVNCASANAIESAVNAWNRRAPRTKATISSDEYIEACKAVEGMAVDKLLDVLKKCGVNVDGK